MKTKEIIEELIKEEKPFDIFSSVYDNKLQKWSLVVIGICIIISLITYFVSPNSFVLGLTMITALLMVIIFSINNTFSQLKYLLSASKEHLHELSIRVEQETRLIQRLTAYDSWSLSQAKGRLNFEADRLEKRIGALVGAMEKLGLFPAIIALYIACAKTLGSTNFTDIPYLLLGFVAGIYLAAFSAVNIIGRLRAYSFIIEIAEDLSSQALEFANNKKEISEQTNNLIKKQITG